MQKVEYLFNGFCELSNIKIDCKSVPVSYKAKCLKYMESDESIKKDIEKSLESNIYKKYIDVEEVLDNVIREMLSSYYMGLTYESRFYLMDKILFEYELEEKVWD